METQKTETQNVASYKDSKEFRQKLHSINNELTSVVSILDLAEADGVADKELATDIHNALSAAVRASDIIKGLLHGARAE